MVYVRDLQEYVHDGGIFDHMFQHESVPMDNCKEGVLEYLKPGSIADWAPVDELYSGDKPFKVDGTYKRCRTFFILSLQYFFLSIFGLCCLCH